MKVFIGKVGETLYEGDAHALTAPGMDGELTVLENHMPLVTTLKAGMVRLQKEKGGEWTEYEVLEGILEVTRDGARVLL